MKRATCAGMVLFFTVVFSSGCGYLSDRGDDALEMFDIGITVTDSWVPQFGLYMDYFQFTPIGWSNFDGKMLGIGHNGVGWIDSRHRAWGVLTTGVEDIQHDVFDGTDPRQAPPGMENERDHPPYYTGLIPAKSLGKKGPGLMHAECNRIIHCGWLGFQMSCRPLDLFDFLLGWFYIDYMKDDDWARGRKARKALQPKPVKTPKPEKVKPLRERRKPNSRPVEVESERERWRREQLRREGAYAPDRQAQRDLERVKKKEKKKQGNAIVRGFRATIKWMRDVEDWVWDHW